MKAPLGLVGLGAIGSALAANLRRRGWPLVVTDRDAGRRDAARQDAARRGATPCRAVPDPRALLAALDEADDEGDADRGPRRVLLVVPAGEPVDAVAAALAPGLRPGDVLVDLGNSHPADTARRQAELTARGVHWIGCGLSGGAEGARTGPCLMAGGDATAWASVADAFEDVAARGPLGVGAARVGAGPAGHLVKTVHNGIEYAWLGAIGEAHELLSALGLPLDEQAACFSAEARERSHALLRHATRVLSTRGVDGGSQLELVADRSEQKGTGRWTVELALEHGVPVPSIAAAVAARSLTTGPAAPGASASGAAPVGAASGVAPVGAASASSGGTALDGRVSPRDVLDALGVAMSAALGEGLELLVAAERRDGLGIDPVAVARLWRHGSLLESLELEELGCGMRDPATCIQGPDPARHPAWRRVVAAAVGAGIPVPVTAAALARGEARHGGRRPAAALVAGLRDAFGRHGVTLREDPGGPRRALDWPGSPDQRVP